MEALDVASTAQMMVKIFREQRAMGRERGNFGGSM